MKKKGCTREGHKFRNSVREVERARDKNTDKQ